MTGFRNALLSAAGAAGGGYSVGNSILGDGTSDYLKRTIGTTGSTQTATFSFWYKPCGLGTNRYLYSSGNDAGGDAADYFSIIFNTSDKFAFDMRIGGVDEVQLITTRVFRDSHAWYHLVVNIDITNATAADRVRVYVNGVRETNWATNTNNLNGTENSVMFTAGEEQYVGSWYYDQTNPFDGYFSEFVCIDGSALDATSFGEYDLNGVWRPINVSGLTFGTNGFYLPFSAGSGANLGASSVSASTFTPAAANYTYNATYLTIGSGTIDNNGSPGVSGRLNNPFNGDFTFSFTATAIAGSIFGVFDATELSTFATGTDDGGLDSMTNSWWYDDGGNGTGGGGTVGNGHFMYGNSSQTTGAIAAGSVVTIERTGSTIKITDDSSDAHSFSQTFSGPVYIMIGHRNITSKSMDYDSVSMNGIEAFAVNGSPTQSSDTPTNNSATLTTIDGSGATFSNGNLVVGSNTTNSYKGGTGCIGLAPGSGSWYVEALCTGATGSNKEYVFGAATNDTNKSVAGYFPGSATYSNDDEHGYYSGSGGIVYNGSSSTGSVGIYGDGDTIALRFDMDVTTPTCKFYVNDTLKHTANLTVGKTYYPHFNTQDSNLTFTVNFGATSFTYTLPTGHLAINTTNLYTNAAPAIEDGTAYFQATAYEGNGGTPQNINQSGNSTFQPDFVWIKNRDAVYQHKLLDAIRGVGQELYSNQTDAETTDTNGLTSFDNDGFGLGTDNGGYNSANSFVAWQWKGDGTSGASNTNGTITSTVNVNDTAGFSIGKYVGSGSNGATVGHGLSAAPEFIIVKNRDQADGWVIYHPTPSATDELRFNNLAASPNSAFWNNTEPTSTVFSVGTSHGTNASTENYIFYAWRSIPGYSSFGTYEGNGNSNGAMLLFDFSPAYIMFKNIDASAQWAIYDNQRDPYNAADKMLFADSSGTENVGNVIDWLANGVKIRGTSAAYNASNTYIYAAFAEHPFAGSSPATAR